MQQLFRRLILLLTLAATAGIIPHKAFATHLAGSDISYTCLGGNTYRIDLTFYRDCRSPSQHPNGVGIEFRSASCSLFFTDTLLLVSGSGQEITYPCPGLTTACDDPASPNPGIQEFKYSGVITFPMQCADWVISWTYCCRNCDITTMVVPLPCVPGSNPPMYVSTTLDNLNIICNSSPHFTNTPIVFVCVGQNFTYNHGAVDPDGDSLVYSLVNPMINSTDSIPFIPPYSATNPISSAPALTIDPLTGDININPTQLEVGVLSVLVQEYRNGVLIGHVVRDMEIYARPCSNIIPTATGMNGTAVHDSTVCPGTQICFDVFSNDLDTGQIVTMTWNQQILSATFTISGFPYPTGHFCWTPGINDISTIPHQFTVTVVDNACPNSGYQTYAFTITVNSPLVNINLLDISCHGLNDGSITVVPGGPGGFSYLWSPGNQTTAGISNLGAGSYPVTVYDSTTGCSATFPNTITDPPLLTDSAFLITASCTGSSSGIVAVIASGGTPQYTYSWNTIPPTLNDTAGGLPIGTYVVTVTDSRNCSVIDSVSVNFSSTALVISVDSVSSLQCYTDTSGIASVSVTGGIPQYTYVWNTIPVQTGPIATGLSPGTYYVTITDSVGCSSTDSAVVTSPPQISIIGSSVPASCNTSDGIAFVNVSGGLPGYTYVWAGFPSTTDSLLNVPPGLYNVTVTDTNSCTQSLGIIVGSQTITATAGAISPISCNGDSNAVAVVVASGGTAPYTYQWNTIPPQNNDTATGLGPGNYIVTVTDSNNCSTIDTVNIPNVITLNVLLSTVNASCAGDSSGSATAHASGGTGPYIYSWAPYGGTDSTAVQLIPGTYTVTVTDAVGCITTITDSVQQNTTITVTVDSITQPGCNGTNSGAIDISVSGGTGAYQYAWVPGGYTSQDLTNINAGNYIVTITDQNNCTQQQMVAVTQPPPVSVNAGPDTAICAYNYIFLDATTPAAGITGTWTGPLAISFTDIHDPNTLASNFPGGFIVLTWTVTDLNGCSSADNITVFNFNLALDAGTDINLCGLSQVQLNATPFPGYNGLWTSSPNINFADSSLYNTNITLNNYGTDTLTWTIGNNACVSSDFLVVEADENPTAEAGDSSTVCANKGQISAIVSPPGAGYWSVRLPSTASIGDTLNPSTSVTNLSTGKNVFVWTMTNGFCSASDTVFVDYDNACELDLPSGFSPNGDGFNDGYFIRGIDGYPLNLFEVYNRWGNKVYTKDNYINTDWKGEDTGGGVLPEGTYFVILTIKNSDIKKSTFVDLRRYSGK